MREKIKEFQKGGKFANEKQCVADIKEKGEENENGMNKERGKSNTWVDQIIDTLIVEGKVETLM